jgi:hypothetical protein
MIGTLLLVAGAVARSGSNVSDMRVSLVLVVAADYSALNNPNLVVR